MNAIKNIAAFLAVCTLAVTVCGCSGSKGDNSDFDFGDGFKQEQSDVYKDGYGRLPNSIRLATYNTHRCAPPQLSVSDYNKTAQVIKLIDPDVIALQELDKNTTTHPTDQLQELADRTGLYPYYCKTIDYRGGDYGIGILSKKTPIKTYSGDLPGVEPRKFFVAEFSDYVFICTHLCHLQASNRTASADIINEYIAANYSDSKKPIFLAGDLNDSSTTSATIAAFLKTWTSIGTTKPTFIDTTTPSRIDYVLIWKGNNPSYEVLGTATPNFEQINVNTVSDHLPVIVDLKK